MSIEVLSTVYTDPNQAGAAGLFTIEESQRYTAVPSQYMIDQSLIYKLSSATVHASSRAGTSLILFSSFIGSFWDYEGSFLQLTNPHGAPSPLIVNSFPPGFDNSAASMLLVANDDLEIRIGVRSAFEKGFKEAIDLLLSGTSARRSGDLMITWHMFPVGFENLDPSLFYVRIIQPLDVVLTAWPDTIATVAYHIFFFLDGGGKLRAQVARWVYWVEDGVKHDEIARQLEEHVRQGVGILNAKLAEYIVFYKISDLVSKDLYLLPGAPPKTRSDVRTANTYDDVTLVLPFSL